MATRSSEQYFPLWGNNNSSSSTKGDVESGLYPGIGETEQILRLGYVDVALLGEDDMFA
jgi:hypothetical protein